MRRLALHILAWCLPCWVLLAGAVRVRGAEPRGGRIRSSAGAIPLSIEDPLLVMGAAAGARPLPVSAPAQEQAEPGKGAKQTPPVQPTPRERVAAPPPPASVVAGGAKDESPDASPPADEEQHAPAVKPAAPKPAPGSKEQPKGRPREQRKLPGEYDPDLPEYRVHTGDRLHISIIGEAGTERQVLVRPDGRVRYLFDIEVMAAGLTHNQLAAALNRKLNEYYINPRVTLIGTSYAGNSVFVMGPIRSPGPHPIQNDTRLLDVLATAGVLGIMPQVRSWDRERRETGAEAVVDLDKAYVARGNHILPVNFRKLLLERDLTQNILLKPRDFIFIPSSLAGEKKVYVLGKVSTPKICRYNGTLSFMEAILEAGGVDSDNGSDTGTRSSGARARCCFIIRHGSDKPLRVDWAAIQMGKAADVPLKNGDIIYVPERALSYVSRVSTSVISEILMPMKSLLELDNTGKRYYRHDWEFRK